VAVTLRAGAFEGVVGGPDGRELLEVGTKAKLSIGWAIWGREDDPTVGWERQRSAAKLVDTVVQALVAGWRVARDDLRRARRERMAGRPRLGMEDFHADMRRWSRASRRARSRSFAIRWAAGSAL